MWESKNKYITSKNRGGAIDFYAKYISPEGAL